MRSLAQEGARAKGITANAVCPGYIATEMVMAVPEKVREAIIGQIPAGRLGDAGRDRALRRLPRRPTMRASSTGSTISANGGQFFS